MLSYSVCIPLRDPLDLTGCSIGLTIPKPRLDRPWNFGGFESLLQFADKRFMKMTKKSMALVLLPGLHPKIEGLVKPDLLKTFSEHWQI
jgi:hypothetical protein